MPVKIKQKAKCYAVATVDLLKAPKANNLGAPKYRYAVGNRIIIDAIDDYKSCNTGAM